MSQQNKSKDLCKFSSSCEFFLEKMKKSSSLKDFLKVDFCVRAPQFCARYIICSTIGMASVPKDLMPYEIQRVKELLV
jgi:hypothetical protein